MRLFIHLEYNDGNMKADTNGFRLAVCFDYQPLIFSIDRTKVIPDGVIILKPLHSSQHSFHCIKLELNLVHCHFIKILFFQIRMNVEGKTNAIYNKDDYGF